LTLLQVGFPHTAVLGRLPGTNVFRNVKQYPEAQQYPGILAVRIDAPLYYANVPVRPQDLLAKCHIFSSLPTRLAETPDLLHCCCAAACRRPLGEYAGRTSCVGVHQTAM
jgi:hypothetical protein